MSLITEDQWAEYEEQGYLRLGRTLPVEELTALQRRIDEVMLGTAPLDYDRMMLQLDTETGEYSDMSPQTLGHKGPSLSYRKIEGLELDPLFLSHMQRPLFGEVCSRVYGPDRPISIFRAMFMNKPAGGGTVLPWHQDIWFRLSSSKSRSKSSLYLKSIWPRSVAGVLDQAGNACPAVVTARSTSTSTQWGVRAMTSPIDG